MSRLAKRALAVVTMAGLALTAAGFTEAGASAAAVRAAGPALYSDQSAGYQASGRLFRYVSATVTVQARTLSYLYSGAAVIGLSGGKYTASISVNPGGGADSVVYSSSVTGLGTFNLAPRVGDRLAVSIFFDQPARHVFYTVADLTRHTTETHNYYVGPAIYSRASLTVQVDRFLSVKSPATDKRLWQFTGTHLTTYIGVHGTITGPWTTQKMIITRSGTASGAVIVSPSGLSAYGRSFTAWLRARR